MIPKGKSQIFDGTCNQLNNRTVVPNLRNNARIAIILITKLQVDLLYSTKLHGCLKALTRLLVMCHYSLFTCKQEERSRKINAGLKSARISAVICCLSWMKDWRHIMGYSAPAQYLLLFVSLLFICIGIYFTTDLYSIDLEFGHKVTKSNTLAIFKHCYRKKKSRVCI